MGRIIAIASGKGGVGKTSAAASLGAALAAFGRKTLLVDMDLGLRNLDTVLGMELMVLNHIGDVLSQTILFEDAITEVTEHPGLFLLPASQVTDPAYMTEEMFHSLFIQLKKQYDIVLVDCPAGIGPYFQAVLSSADEGIAVAEPVVASVRDADKVLHLMEEAGIEYRFVLVNKLHYRLMKDTVMMMPDEISEVLGVPLLGVVPYDEQVIVYSNKGKSLAGSRTPAGKAFGRIAERMTGRSVSVPPLRKGMKGLFR